MLQNIRIVLVETSHTGNMGSTARAMKTMGLSRLYLVNPLIKPDSQAISLAAGASDIIGGATVVDTLEEALEGCTLVLGASARSRSLSWPTMTPRECGQQVVKKAQTDQVALVFGRERIGLTNEELQKCHYHIVIPTNPEYGSLNLAMAVQILAYEIYTAAGVVESVQQQESEAVERPLFEDQERFYTHLEQVLLDVGFMRRTHPGQIMNRLRRLFARAHLESQELNILRGILAAIEKHHGMKNGQ